MRCIEGAMGQGDAKVCAVCGECRPRECFSGRMWANVAEQDRKCTRCIEGAKVQRGCWKCVACKDVFPKEDFCRWLGNRTTERADGKQRCNKCVVHEERKRKEVADRSFRSVDSVTKKSKTE